jgi:hypothetical protein
MLQDRGAKSFNACKRIRRTTRCRSHIPGRGSSCRSPLRMSRIKLESRWAAGPMRQVRHLSCPYTSVPPATIRGRQDGSRSGTEPDEEPNSDEQRRSPGGVAIRVESQRDQTRELVSSRKARTSSLWRSLSEPASAHTRFFAPSV